MKFQKHSSDQRVTPPYFTLIKSMACGLALLASGQAFALPYYYSLSNISDADLIDGTKWATGSCADPAGSGAIAMTSTNNLIVCPGYSLNLSSAVTVNVANLVFNTSATWAGAGLKFSAGNKTIVNSNTSLPAIALDISDMVDGNTITINSNSVTFFSLAAVGRSLSCATSYPATIAAGTICTVGAAAAVNNSVSAPIFSTKEKPAVFSEEVK